MLKLWAKGPGALSGGGETWLVLKVVLDFTGGERGKGYEQRWRQ